METLFILAMMYVAVGAACCAHPRGVAEPAHFDWRAQIEVFRSTLPDVLGWPLVLLRRSQV